MPKTSVIDKIMDSYRNDEEVVLNKEEQNYKKRLEFILDEKINDLAVTDKDIYNIVIKKFKFVTFVQILKDITIVERIIANQISFSGDPQKIFMRYFISEIGKEAIAFARLKGDAYALTQTLNMLGKHHLTDKEDEEKHPWDKIVPFLPELTNDPTILGIKPIDNLEDVKLKLKEKYSIDFQKELNSKIEDVDYEEA